MKIKFRKYTEEPMHCEKIGCLEGLNGLNRGTIDLGNGFVFDLWLCDKCKKEFKKQEGKIK